MEIISGSNSVKSVGLKQRMAMVKVQLHQDFIYDDQLLRALHVSTQWNGMFVSHVCVGRAIFRLSVV